VNEGSETDRGENASELDLDELGGDDGSAVSQSGPEFRSGFVSILGRPNVGKSTLVNEMLNAKVSITSASPNTTRTRVRGILDGDGYQIVLVDTPGIHKPKTALGERLNTTATDALDDVDICILVVDASAAIGLGDRFVAAQVPARSVVVLNKIDRLPRERLLPQLAEASALGVEDAEYFPVSAKSGDGVAELIAHLVARLPVGPRYFPEGSLSDVTDEFFLGELVREQLLRVAREELPHSIACRVTEWEPPYVRCEILVERESQKAIVVGKGGAVLKEVGIAVRRALPPGTYLDLVVKVERDWQRRPDMIERLGY
jgi:GTP-binding protein Era